MPCALGATGICSTLQASWLFVFIGARPLTEWLDGVVRSRPPRLRAHRSRPARRRPAARRAGRSTGIRGTSSPTFPACSSPATVRRSDSGEARARSAVGEGAMAVTLVHRYLERLCPHESSRPTRGSTARRPRPVTQDTRLSPDELRALFLFESLDDEQARLAAETGGSGRPGRRTGASPGRPGRPLIRAARREMAMPAGSVRPRTSRSTALRIRRLRGRHPGVPARRATFSRNTSLAAHDHPGTAVRAARGTEWADAVRGLVPDGDSPARGTVLRHSELAADWSVSASSCSPSARCRPA